MNSFASTVINFKEKKNEETERPTSKQIKAKRCETKDSK